MFNLSSVYITWTLKTKQQILKEEHIVHIICADTTNLTFYIYHELLWFILFIAAVLHFCQITLTLASLVSIHINDTAEYANQNLA